MEATFVYPNTRTRAPFYNKHAYMPPLTFAKPRKLEFDLSLAWSAPSSATSLPRPTQLEIHTAQYRSNIAPQAVFAILHAFEIRYDLPVVFRTTHNESGVTRAHPLYS